MWTDLKISINVSGFKLILLFTESIFNYVSFNIAHDGYISI